MPIQLKNFTPVGTAMSMVTMPKKGSSTRPVAYMWWAHTPTDRAPMAMVAKTKPLYPNTGLRAKIENTSVTTPKYGRIRM